MREAGQSVYPNDIDPLIFYQDPNIEKHPLLARYYELINQNKFSEAKEYLQSVDLDYYGSWLLNKIENRLYTVEQHIPDVIGEKPKLVIHKWPEPADNEYTEECFCWTNKGYMIDERGNMDNVDNHGTSNIFNSGEGAFWHCYININAMHADVSHMLNEDNFYFTRYPSGDPNYGTIGLKSTTVNRATGDINDFGITTFKLNSLQSQDIRIPVYSNGVLDDSYHIRLLIEDVSIEELGPYIRYSFTHKIGLYNDDSYRGGTYDSLEWVVPIGSENHFYLFAGIGPVFGNARGSTTISDILYFGVIQKHFQTSQQKGVKFHGLGLDLTALNSLYNLTIDRNFVPENPK